VICGELGGIASKSLKIRQPADGGEELAFVNEVEMTLRTLNSSSEQANVFAFEKV
jgi:hypothetical protein